MRIFAKIDNGKCVPIHVQKKYKIRYIKKKIHEKMHLDPEEQNFYYQNMILMDEKTIEDYQIVDKSIIHIVVKSSKRIFVKTPSGHIFAFSVEPSDEIRHLKLRIEKAIGIKVEIQNLFSGHEILEDGKTFLECRIVNNSLIDINIEKPIEIFVKSWSGEIEEIFVLKTDKTSDLKLKIKKKFKIAPDKQLLVYNKRIMWFDEKTIEDLGIHGGYVIEIITSWRFINTIQIMTRTSNGKQLKISAKITDETSNIKEEIQNQIKIAVYMRGLSNYYDMILWDNLTVVDINRVPSILMISSRDYVPFHAQSGSMHAGEIGETRRINKQPRIQLESNYETVSIESQSIYNIQNNSYTIFPFEMFTSNIHGNTARDEGNIIIINVAIGDGQHLKLFASRNEKISNIKMQIYKKCNLHPCKQILYMDSKLLEDDDKAIGDYISPTGAIFILLFSLLLYIMSWIGLGSREVSVNISVKLRDSSLFPWDSDDCDITNVKKKIQQRMLLDGQHQKKLVIHNSQLINDQLFYEFYIVDRSQYENYSNFEKFNQLIKSIKEGSITGVKKYFKDSLIEFKHGSYSRSPLLYACKSSQLVIIEYFISKKCNLESFDCELRSAIHYAVLNRNNDIVKRLIDSGANINAPDSLLMMPIHLACKANNIEAVRLLIESNCDMNSLDRLNRSPLEIAKDGGFENLIILIKECQTIRVMANEMQLKCYDGCTHTFCYTAFQRKKIKKSTPIAIGGFGKVFLCKESGTDRKFVVKKIKKNDIQHEYIEANINDFKDLLCHKRIVKHFGAFYKKEKHYIFMEYLSGNSLKEKIKKVQMRSPKFVLLFTKQILEALVFIHRREIIHRDVKPENVLLDVHENLKLSDFGLSLLLSSVAKDIQKDGSFCGTPYYTAPEILNAEMYSCSVDIWSLGATVIELCTGYPPYHELGEGCIKDKILTTREIEYKLPGNMPNYIKTLIDHMLEKEKLERPCAEKLLSMVTKL